MNKVFFAGTLVLLGLSGFSAQASDRWSVHVNIGGYPPPPVIHYGVPSHGYSRHDTVPRVIYPPTHYGPHGIYQPPPVYLAPPPVVYYYPPPHYQRHDRYDRHGPNRDWRDQRYGDRRSWHDRQR